MTETLPDLKSMTGVKAEDELVPVSTGASPGELEIAARRVGDRGELVASLAPVGGADPDGLSAKRSRYVSLS